MNSSIFFKSAQNPNYKRLIFTVKQLSNQNVWTNNRFINTAAKVNGINSFRAFLGDSGNRKSEKKAKIFASSLFVISGLIGFF